MLARVRQLEIEKVHPILARLGGEAGWAEVRADVEVGLSEGRYDRRDMLVVMACMRYWITGPPESTPANLKGNHRNCGLAR
tara:strand:- start:3318 stop:3560 length:243 start_codon:yes stop_codon:yes gene_type:complete